MQYSPAYTAIDAEKHAVLPHHYCINLSTGAVKLHYALHQPQCICSLTPHILMFLQGSKQVSCDLTAQIAVRGCRFRQPAALPGHFGNCSSGPLPLEMVFQIVSFNINLDTITRIAT